MQVEVDHLPEVIRLIGLVERGNRVLLIRDREAVAEIVAKPARDDAYWSKWQADLKAIQQAVPPAARGGSDSVRKMRDEGY